MRKCGSHLAMKSAIVTPNETCYETEEMAEETAEEMAEEETAEEMAEEETAEEMAEEKTAADQGGGRT